MAGILNGVQLFFLEITLVSCFTWPTFFFCLSAQTHINTLRYISIRDNGAFNVMCRMSTSFNKKLVRLNLNLLPHV